MNEDERRVRLAEQNANGWAVAVPTLNAIAHTYAAVMKEVPSGGRLSRRQTVKILSPVYRAVRKWTKSEEIWDVASALQSKDPAMDSEATYFYMVVSFALRSVDLKKCSKWAAALDVADYYDVRPGDLGEFLGEVGGIEGAARKRAKVWRRATDGERLLVSYYGEVLPRGLSRVNADLLPKRREWEAWS